MFQFNVAPFLNSHFVQVLMIVMVHNSKIIKLTSPVTIVINFNPIKIYNQLWLLKGLVNVKKLLPAYKVAKFRRVIEVDAVASIKRPICASQIPEP